MVSRRKSADARKFCVCDEHTWGDKIGRMCDQYTPLNGHGSYCAICDHDEACHVNKAHGTKRVGQDNV